MCLEDVSGPKSFYFVGIGGVSMSALACLMKDRGAAVRGSDAAEGEYTRMLARRNIPVSIGEDEKIAEDCVVYSGAVGEDRPQLRAAKAAGKRLIGRAELLGMIAEEYPHVVSVAGCHGKTTASCMLSHVLYAAEAPFTCHIGGEDLTFGNYYCAGGEYFVTEACEFRRSFLCLKSEIAVILNCDLDHTDCYPDEKALLEAYRTFASQAKRVVVCADDERARSIPHTLSFGIRTGTIRAEEIRAEKERYSFTVTEKGCAVVRVSLSAVGRVHIYNALAAYAAARLLGISAAQIKRGLEAFKGVKRRFERVGTFCGAPVICDYAHHPREIAAAISTADRLASGKVRVVFQPHTYTRTRDLMDGFVSALMKCESPLIYSTFSARESYIYAGSAAALAARLPDARYVQSPAQLKKRLAEHMQEGDMVLVLGAGDIYDIVRGILGRSQR